MHLDYNLSNNSFDFLCFNKLIASNKKFDVNYYYSIEITNANFDKNLICLRIHFK